VSWVFACSGWGLAFVLIVLLRARLALAADAEHELRGAATAIRLAAERMQRVGATRGFASLLALQLDRMDAALRDLARVRGAPPRSRSGAPAPRLDVGRLSQVVANLVDNAAEHGAGPVDVRWSATRGGTRLEIRNANGRGPDAPDSRAPVRPDGPRPGGLLSAESGRGRGLAIAGRAARELGGRLWVESDEESTVATLELPAADRGRSSRAA
jgi:signal transduction histidine kinase